LREKFGKHAKTLAYDVNVTMMEIELLTSLMGHGREGG
jgi:hypothetical protein